MKNVTKVAHIISKVIPNSKKPILKDRGYELHCSVKIVAVSMDSLKDKILEKLEHLPKFSVHYSYTVFLNS